MKSLIDLTDRAWLPDAWMVSHYRLKKVAVGELQHR